MFQMLRWLTVCCSYSNYCLKPLLVLTSSCTENLNDCTCISRKDTCAAMLSELLKSVLYRQSNFTIEFVFWSNIYRPTSLLFISIRYNDFTMLRWLLITSLPTSRFMLLELLSIMSLAKQGPLFLPRSKLQSAPCFLGKVCVLANFGIGLVRYIIQMSTFASGWLGASSFIILLVGIMGIIYSVFEFSSISEVVNKLHSYQLSSSLVILIFSLLLCLVGTAGLYGTCRDNKCVIAIFNISSVVLLVLAIGVGAFGFFGPNLVFKQNCQESTVEWFSGLSTAYSVGQETLCSDDCKCYIKDISIYDQNATKILQKKKFDNDAKLPSTYENCTNNIWNLNYTDFKLLQINFNCTGWCTPLGYFVFSDINKNPGQQGCYQSIKNFVEQNGKLIGILGIVSALIFGINVGLGCFVCLRSRQKNSKDYARMADLDN